MFIYVLPSPLPLPLRLGILRFFCISLPPLLVILSLSSESRPSVQPSNSALALTHGPTNSTAPSGHSGSASVTALPNVPSLPVFVLPSVSTPPHSSNPALLPPAHPALPPLLPSSALTPLSDLAPLPTDRERVLTKFSRLLSRSENLIPEMSTDSPLESDTKF